MKHEKPLFFIGHKFGDLYMTNNGLKKASLQLYICLFKKLCPTPLSNAEGLHARS
ncbi:hypothetical protein Hanom_Chr03g00191571 [Helianthus anomalus]